MKTGTHRTIEVRYPQGERNSAYDQHAADKRRGPESMGLSNWRPMDNGLVDPTCRGKGLTVGPHNRCTHETAPPRGWKRCKAGYDCPVLLPGAGPDWCSEHRWTSDATADARERLAQLMEA